MTDEERDEHGERRPVDEDNRKGDATLAEILGSCLRNAAAQHERDERERTLAAEHQATCKAEECHTCGRRRCHRCGDIYVTRGHACAKCIATEQYSQAKARVFESVPVRFKWALDCDPRMLTSRVRLQAAKIAGALTWAKGLEVRPTPLVLTGATGTGKTSLAVALFATWFATHRNEDARFVSCISLTLARRSYPLGQGTAPLIEQAAKASLLILDDVGAEGRAEVDADTIRSLLHARYDADLPTWFTTGLEYPDISSRYDGGIARRMFEESKNVRLGEDPS